MELTNYQYLDTLEQMAADIANFAVMSDAFGEDQTKEALASLASAFEAIHIPYTTLCALEDSDQEKIARAYDEAGKRIRGHIRDIENMPVIAKAEDTDPPAENWRTDVESTIKLGICAEIRSLRDTLALNRIFDPGMTHEWSLVHDVAEKLAFDRDLGYGNKYDTVRAVVHGCIFYEKNSLEEILAEETKRRPPRIPFDRQIADRAYILTRELLASRPRPRPGLAG